MKNKNISELISLESNTIKETMRIIDKNALGIAFIVNSDQKLKGVVTDGDIRRAIINGSDVDEKISFAINTNPITESIKKPIPELLEIIKGKKIKILPLLDENDSVVDFIFHDTIKESIPSLNENITHNNKNHSIKKILIVGGAGYLGSVLSQKLLNKGYKVRVLDLLFFGEESIKTFYEHKNFEIIKEDMRNIESVVKAVKGVDAVVHLAAMVGDPACALNPENTIENNYFATKLLAEICKYNQINRFVFASTCSVYGANSTITLTEDSELMPVSLYAKTKLKSEDALLSMADNNFAPCILRMATIYGPSKRMRFDLVVNILTAKAIKEKKINIFGGSQWRPLVHVEDAADAYITYLEAPIEKINGEIFNVGSNKQNYQIFELGNIIKELIPDIKIEISKDDVDKRDYRVSFDKISNVLGYTTKKTIKDGVLGIKDLFDKNIVKDYSEKKYSNYKRFVSEDT